MPDGKTHDALWVYGQALAYPASALVCISNGWLGLGMAGGYFLGRLITPDSDLVGITHGEGQLMRNYGCLGGLLVSYFTFYGFIFRGKHRSFWTHGLILSTAIRFIYTFWILAIWLYNYHRDWLLPETYLFSFGVFLGMCFSDFIHIVADWTTKENQTKKRMRGWSK